MSFSQKNQSETEKAEVKVGLKELTAEEAQNKLPDYTYDEYGEYKRLGYLSLSIKIGTPKYPLCRKPIFQKQMYINYLCARGDLDKLKVFMDIQEEQIENILNERLYDYHTKKDIYLFQTILQWNKVEKADRLFDLLTSYGAIISTDDEGNHPWDNLSKEWIEPIPPFEKIGIRNSLEFVETHVYFFNKYDDGSYGPIHYGENFKNVLPYPMWRRDVTKTDEKILTDVVLERFGCSNKESKVESKDLKKSKVEIRDVTRSDEKILIDILLERFGCSNMEPKVEPKVETREEKYDYLKMVDDIFSGRTPPEWASKPVP